MSNLLDLHRIATDADYFVALDELEQLIDVARPTRCARATELTEMIAEFEARVARALAQAAKSRALIN